MQDHEGSCTVSILELINLSKIYMRICVIIYYFTQYLDNDSVDIFCSNSSVFIWTINGVDSMYIVY